MKLLSPLLLCTLLLTGGLLPLHDGHAQPENAFPIITPENASAVALIGTPGYGQFNELLATEHTLYIAASGGLLAYPDGDLSATPDVLLTDYTRIQTLHMDNQGRLAVGTQDGDIIVLDTTDHSPLMTLSTEFDTLVHVQFSPSGDYLLAMPPYGYPRLYDLNREVWLPEIDAGDYRIEADGLFSPNGRWLVLREQNGLLIWNLTEDKGNILQRTSSRSIAFSADGQRLFNLDYTGDLWEIDLLSGIPSIIETGMNEQAGIMAISPDGSRLALLDGTGGILVLDGNTYEHLATFETDIQGEFAQDMTFSADNRLLTILIWYDQLYQVDIATQTVVHSFENHLRTITHFGITADPLLYMATDKEMIWRWPVDLAALYRGEYPAIEEHLPIPETRYLRRYFSPDGRLFITTGTGEFSVYDMQTRHTHTHPLEINNWINQVAVSRDNRLIALAADNWIIDLVSTGDGKRLAKHQGENNVDELTFSPEGDELVIIDYNTNMYLWDLTQTDAITVSDQLFEGVPNERTSNATYSPDSRWLAFTQGAEHIIIIDRETAGVHQTIDMVSGQTFQHLAFNPAGSLLIVSRIIDEQGEIIIYDVASGAQLHHINTGHSLISYTKFSPEGRFFITADHHQHVQVWAIPPADSR